jgi:hypothetical protein
MNECEVCTHYRRLTPVEGEAFAVDLARVKSKADDGQLNRFGSVIAVGKGPDGRGPVWLDTMDVEAHTGYGNSWAHAGRQRVHDYDLADALERLTLLAHGLTEDEVREHQAVAVYVRRGLALRNRR